MPSLRFSSLEEFLNSRSLSVDGVADDGWGELLPVRGREIESSVLLADISGHSRRTRNLTATETLVFANHSFAWIAGEGLRGCPGIVDKYIGDEIMVVFSKELGSAVPFVVALRSARFMLELDEWGFRTTCWNRQRERQGGLRGDPTRIDQSVRKRIVFPASE